MSDEDKDKQEPTMSASEEKARKGGWVPEEEWKGDSAQWVDHSIFNIKGEFMDRIREQSDVISTQGKKIQEREDALKDMKDMQTKIAEKAYKDALNDLKAKKAEAMEGGDHMGVINIDDEISDLKENKPKFDAEEDDKGGSADQGEDQLPAEIVEWMGKPENKWYHTDTALRGMADGIANSILSKNPNTPPAQLLREVEATLKKELPHRFGSGSDDGDVSDGGDNNRSSRNNRKKTLTINDLDEFQQGVCKRLVKIGTFKNNAEYIEALQKAGDA
jgi:hypothetical protein